MRNSLEQEIQSSLAAGMRRLTMEQLDAELAALGYRRMPGSRCACTAHNLTSNNRYPCVTWGVQEIDTGLSAFHVDARRDANFEALQELRRSTFAVVRGAFVSV